MKSGKTVKQKDDTEKLVLSIQLFKINFKYRYKSYVEEFPETSMQMSEKHF